ncbi:Epsin domain [Macleaya cordata]|uniref:Epsin domain n=1 Tax=Macleaya cordata TaxID=56857 RepID=A0A200QLN8_MACCD|nr:Epsin domain [Macleaya cordata]
MDFMKVFDQAVREIKREVNIKVLKVPEIEQKVLDATSDEPWGPHGSDLTEIAQATRKITECQMVMNVLWTRLTERGGNWRYVYKALAVIEYLVANGAERAVDDIIEHTFQISSLSGFEYVEPSNGKDMGINVRKKVETILALLNDKNKIQEVRNKAAANRDKYIGLSSTGITYKASSASYGSSSFQQNDRYGGFSSKKDGDMFKDSYKDRDRFGGEEFGKGSRDKSRRGVSSEDEGQNLKKGSTRRGSRDQNALSSSSKLNHSDDKYGSIPSQSSTTPNDADDDFDDFDPRGTSTTGSAAASVTPQVDLFGDLMDAPISVAPETNAVNGNSAAEVDLFADATFVSASPKLEAGPDSQAQTNVDLFASGPTVPSSFDSTVDFFAAPDPIPQTDTKPAKSEPLNSSPIDPFAALPVNSFDGSDLFGAFTSHTDQVSSEAAHNPANDSTLNGENQKPSTESKQPKKNTFQVKSGIWADSLSRGLIDLNITAPTAKKTNLADIGIVGGLSDTSDEKDKAAQTSFYMGRAMGVGSGYGISGFTSTGMGSGDDFFSTPSQPQSYGSFKK